MAAIAFLQLALCLLVPINHDETQYVAATSLVSQGYLPYAHFAYLQTPLQPFLLAPLNWIAPGWLLLTSRLLNALMVVGTVVVTGKIAERLSGNVAITTLAMLAVFTVDGVQFAGSVARNDAIPLFLFTFGLERLIGAGGSRKRLFVAGLLLAAAASTKISYALPCVAVAGQAIFRCKLADRRRLAALIGGMAIGALPTFAGFMVAPSQFLFEVVTYSVDGVRAYQVLKGTDYLLSLDWRLIRFVQFLLLGPALPLVGAAVWLAWMSRHETRRPDLGIEFGPILVAAMLAAVLPMPTYRQYIVPLAVPLILYCAAHPNWFARLAATRGFKLICSFGAVLGLSASVLDVVTAQPSQRPIAVELQSHQLGKLLHAIPVTQVTGMDAARLVDTGIRLDPRLAAGPFLFRAGNLNACRDARLCPVTYQSVHRLNQAPPQAILTGSEGRPLRGLPAGLDGALEGWANLHGYHLFVMKSGRLWIRPDHSHRV